MEERQDLISRQATITEFKNYERDSTAPIDYVKIVEQMTSVQPEREKSEWIEEDYVTKIKIRCKKCGEYARGIYMSKFCPNCGRYMWGKNNGKTT